MRSPNEFLGFVGPNERKIIELLKFGESPKLKVKLAGTRANLDALAGTERFELGRAAMRDSWSILRKPDLVIVPVPASASRFARVPASLTLSFGDSPNFSSSMIFRSFGPTKPRNSLGIALLSSVSLKSPGPISTSARTVPVLDSRTASCTKSCPFFHATPASKLRAFIPSIETPPSNPAHSGKTPAPSRQPRSDCRLQLGRLVEGDLFKPGPPAPPAAATAPSSARRSHRSGRSRWQNPSHRQSGCCRRVRSFEGS